MERSNKTYDNEPLQKLCVGVSVSEIGEKTERSTHLIWFEFTYVGMHILSLNSDSFVWVSFPPVRQKKDNTRECVEEGKAFKSIWFISPVLFYFIQLLRINQHSSSFCPNPFL
jgi:hypothetical protein